MAHSAQGEIGGHVPAALIAKEFGFTARHWTRQAAAGKVPGAYQPSGEGGRWLFNLTVFRRWWGTKEREVREWRGFTGAGRHGGAAPSVRGRSTGVLLAQEIDALLKSVCGNG